MKPVALRKCGDCDALPNTLHVPGCDMERCPLCGGQIISCSCIYELAGMSMATLATDHPMVYSAGPDDVMVKRFEEAIEAAGGPLPWPGEPDAWAACREAGLYCYWGHRETGAPMEFAEQPGKWFECDATHPDAFPDSNRLHTAARWDRPSRKWVRTP